ncbi:hypothetical protein ACMFMF_001182 [Clarireedia jacksonii]
MKKFTENRNTDEIPYERWLVCSSMLEWLSSQRLRLLNVFSLCTIRSLHAGKYNEYSFIYSVFVNLSYCMELMECQMAESDHLLLACITTPLPPLLLAHHIFYPEIGS